MSSRMRLLLSGSYPKAKLTSFCVPLIARVVSRNGEKLHEEYFGQWYVCFDHVFPFSFQRLIFRDGFLKGE